MEPTTTKKPRGFAAMTPEHHRQVASMGGSAAQALGTCHRFTSESARAAGRKGGLATQERSRARRAEKNASS